MQILKAYKTLHCPLLQYVIEPTGPEIVFTSSICENLVRFCCQVHSCYAYIFWQVISTLIDSLRISGLICFDDMFLSPSGQVEESKNCFVIKVEDKDGHEELSVTGIALSPSPTHSDVSVSRWVVNNTHPDSVAVTPSKLVVLLCFSFLFYNLHTVWYELV